MHHQSRLIIDLSIIQRNYQILRQHIAQNTDGTDRIVAGMVKADAYGLGAAQVIPALEKAGCELFFVATPSEAFPARTITDQKIAVLNPVLTEDLAQSLANHGIMPVLNSLQDIQIWSEFCQRINHRYPAIIQFDTGMHRVGLSMNDLAHLVQSNRILGSFDTYMIMSHFASADDLSSDFTAQQHQTFEKMWRLLPASILDTAKLCLSNSAGTALDQTYHYDAVRPGKSVFGLQALEAQPSSQPAMHFSSPITLEAQVIQIVDVKQGETIGYNETWRADQDMQVATIAMGYADGLRRHLSNKGHLLFQGHKMPITGRVSMDMTMVRIDHLGKDAPQRGDWVQFLNAEQTADDVAKLIGTNGYEILTGLGKRAERLYIERERNIVENPISDTAETTIQDNPLYHAHVA